MVGALVTQGGHLEACPSQEPRPPGLMTRSPTSGYAAPTLNSGHSITIDTEIQAKRNKIVSELITFS